MGKTKTVLVGEEQPVKAAKKKAPEKKPEKVKVPGLKGGERVRAVEAEVIGPEKLTPKKVAKRARARQVKERGRKYKAARRRVETGKEYPAKEAVKLAQETHVGKFDGKIELHFKLSGKLDTQIELPYSTGQEKRVEVASEATLKKLEAGKVDFDVLLATPEMMPKLAKYAKLLGPRGLFPNPKAGTIVKDAEGAKEKWGGKNIRIVTEKKAPVAHVVIGKTDQKTGEVAANLETILEVVGKKIAVKKAVVSATMGPGVRVNIK